MQRQNGAGVTMRSNKDNIVDEGQRAIADLMSAFVKT
jgi:hypothetical protein